MITDEDFATLTKKYFMAILALRLKRILLEASATQMVKISDNNLTNEDRNRASDCIDDAWLEHLGLDSIEFMYYEMKTET